MYLFHTRSNLVAPSVIYASPTDYSGGITQIEGTTKVNKPGNTLRVQLWK